MLDMKPVSYTNKISRVVKVPFIRYYDCQKIIKDYILLAFMLLLDSNLGPILQANTATLMDGL